MLSTQRPALITTLVVGNVILALIAFGVVIYGVVGFVIPRAADGLHAGALVLMSLICLLVAICGASYLRGAHGLLRRQPYGPNVTRGVVNMSLVPWALLVLRGGYELISDGTTRWEFFIPGLVLTAFFLGYRSLLTRPAVQQWISSPGAIQPQH